MDLYNIAKRLSRLIPEGSYTNLNQLFIYIKTNKTFQQFTQNFPLEVTIKLTFYLDAVLRNVEKKTVDWSINNNLYTFDMICFGKEPGMVECGYCGGGGTESCDYCGGSGSESCNECGGDGKVDVEDDEGNTEQEECEWCDGEGDLSCDNCGGDGEYNCHRCDGNGEVEDIQEVPEILVTTYIAYDLNLESVIEGFLSEMNEVEDTKFTSEFPVLFAMERKYSSEDIATSSIPKQNWDKCFINKVEDFEPGRFSATGTNYQVLRWVEPGTYYDINEKLLD